MGAQDYLYDKQFLRALDNYGNKAVWVRIEVLDLKGIPIKCIEGRVQTGCSININASSSMRRTCNLNIIAEDKENDLTDIDNLLSVNKRIKIFEGIKNNINTRYDDIIWFPLGVFVITQPSISHTTNGCIIQLNCKDKMCLLNGECAGTLPTSVTFHEYNQIIGKLDCTSDPTKDSSLEPNNYTVYCYQNRYYTWSKNFGWEEQPDASLVGTVTAIPQLIYDIIQTLVCNYGGESLDRIIINDVPLEIKQIVRYIGSNTLYYNTATGMYTLDSDYVTTDGTWQTFEFNEDIGYVYTDFTYPGKLVSSLGDNIASVLEKIKNTLGNYEFFYDIEGNFIFQEVKNYLNNSYLPLDDRYEYRLDKNRERKVEDNNLDILDNLNYKVNFNNSIGKSVYIFNEGNGLVTSFSNTPNYGNLKNDYHIWGENADGYAIHYHLAIKNKPTFMNKYKVVFLKDGDTYTGGLRLAKDTDSSLDTVDYIPADWRAELYLQGLTKQQKQQRPDIYEQELLDLFDSIYNFKEKKFKTDITLRPNLLNYFFDYIEPLDRLSDCSVDTIGTKIYSYQQDKIRKLYNTDIPNIILISLTMDEKLREELINKCELTGQPYSNVNPVVYSKIAIGTVGYTAQEVTRDLLYQYTTYNESITLQTVPIYYLDVNTRITVQDLKSGIYGDYIINSISLPLDGGNAMSITASRALERI